MIRPADVLDLIDRLAAWLAGELSWLPPTGRAVVAVPAVVIVLCALLRVGVRRVLPMIGRYLVVPGVALITGLIAAMALIADFLLTQVFRAFWLPLTTMHYAIGDLTMAGTEDLRTVTRSSARRAGRWLGRFNGGVLLAAGLGLAIWWNLTFCTRHPAMGCATPFAQWRHDAWGLWQSVLG